MLVCLFYFIMDENVKDIFENEPYHQLATSSKSGIPNICNIGAKFIRDDGKIVVVDNYMRKTIENLKENSEVAILVRREKESYQIKGVARYVNSGEEYKEGRDWMKSKGDKYPAKGAVIIEVDSVYNSMTGESAGLKIKK